MPIHRATGLFFLLLFVAANSSVRADVFDQHTLDVLRQFGEASKPIDGLSMASAQELKPLSKKDSNPVIVVKTDEGNWTKAEISWGFRRGTDGLIPVLLLERYVTYRKDSVSTAIVSGKEVMVFAGFEFNFDIGQVVPAGQGGDITFTADKKLAVLKDAALWGLNGSQLAEAAPDAPQQPADREGIFPADFAGKWTVDVDGRWKGTWDLKVNENGRITGSFTSADTQSTYLLDGRVANPPHHARFIVHFDNAEQQVDAYLWTKDKSAIAGSCTLGGQSFGFYALREAPPVKD